MNNYISAIGTLASVYVLGEAVSIGDWLVAFCMIASIACFAFVSILEG